jgi:hypothetical protein
MLVVTSLDIISEMNLEFECVKRRRQIRRYEILQNVTGYHMEIFQSYDRLCVGLWLQLKTKKMLLRCEDTETTNKKAHL